MSLPFQTKSSSYLNAFVLDFLDKLKKNNIGTMNNVSIHNTWCWGWELHLRFAKELENYWGIVINSDVDTIRWEWKPDHYAIYNILEKCNFKANIVLCVSTLEHLDNQIKALENLLDSVREWWYLIITLDCPPVNLIEIENYLGVKCKDVKERLDPKNSVCSHYSWEWINIVKLIIQK